MNEDRSNLHRAVATYMLQNQFPYSDVATMEEWLAEKPDSYFPSTIVGFEFIENVVADWLQN